MSSKYFLHSAHPSETVFCIKRVHPIIFESNVFHNSFDSEMYTKSAAIADFVYTSESKERCEKHST